MNKQNKRKKKSKQEQINTNKPKQTTVRVDAHIQNCVTGRVERLTTTHHHAFTSQPTFTALLMYQSDCVIFVFEMLKFTSIRLIHLTS